MQPENFVKCRTDSLMFSTFDTVMGESRKNISAGIFILFLMFVFFSFNHEEKERQIKRTTAQSSVITDANSSGQAIIGPEISAPGINLIRTRTLSAKFACPDCTSGREFVFNKLVSSSLNSRQFRFHFRNPIISLFLLQKVPEQRKEDDILSII